MTTGTVTPILLKPNGACVNPVGIVYYAPDPGVPIATNLSQSLWVVCNAIPNEVVELNPLSSTPGQIQAATAPNKIGSCVCSNIAFDGRYVWTATPNEPHTAAAAVQQIDTTTSSLTVTNTQLPLGASPVAWRSMEYVWTIDGSNSNVFKVLPSVTPGQPGTLYGPFTNPGGASFFLGFDGGQYVGIDSQLIEQCLLASENVMDRPAVCQAAPKAMVTLTIRCGKSPTAFRTRLRAYVLGAVSGCRRFASTLGFGSFTMFFSCRLIHNSTGKL